MTTRVYLDSLGCKLNQCERDMLAGQFVAAGYEIVSDCERADLCVLNSCAVTRAAAGKSRRRLRALRRANPAIRLVLTGCYAGVVRVDPAGDSIDPDLIVPNAQKDELISCVQARLGGEEGLASDPRVCGRDAVRPRTRPLVKIQDGCDNACAYCIVHRLRGKQRSRSRDEIVAEVLALRAQGYHEVVLTGVHVGAYGRERGESLTALLTELLAALGPPGQNSFRLRLSSIEPWDLTSEFLALWNDPRLCRHLHLPLQSGCDATLARMNRGYTAAQYAAWAAQARTAIPGLALTTDVIAGLPGETPNDHAASVAFCEQIRFARLHVFAYSARPCTPAAEMPDQVPIQERRARAAELRQVGRRSAKAFRRQLVGLTLPVLIERGRSGGADGRWTGLTDNYVRVYLRSPRELGNTVCLVRLCEPQGRGLRGELVS